MKITNCQFEVIISPLRFFPGCSYPCQKKTDYYYQHSKEWAWKNHLVDDFGIRPCIPVFPNIRRTDLESYPEPPGGKNDD